MKSKRTKKMIHTIFILLFYIATSASIMYADKADKISIEELASIEIKEAIGLRIINIKDDIYILIMFRDYLQMFKYSGKMLQPGEKYSISDQPASSYKTRRPSANIIINQKQDDRSILIACNTLKAGLHHSLRTVSPFISFGIGQPVAAGKLNGINFVMTDRYGEGADIFKGELNIFRSDDSQLLSAHRIKPYYKIIPHLNATNEIESWLILNSTNELIISDEDFTHFTNTGLKTGDFALLNSPENRILIITSEETIAGNMNDSLRFYTIDYQESKLETKFIGEADFPFLINYFDLLDNDGNLLIVIVKGDGEKSVLSVWKVEF